MVPDGTLSPEDAFAALGNEIRVAVLRVLAAATDDGETALPFTELYRRLDIDSTSQLSYHLDHLEGVFVRKTASGYALTQAGDRVVRAIRSGTYTEVPSFPPTDVEGRCPDCGTETLRAEYREPFLVVACPECDTQVVRYDLPPAESRDRTPMEILRSCDRRVHHEYAMALQGTCSMCGGLTSVETRRRDDPLTDTYYCVAACGRCDHRVFAPLEVRLLTHPAVVSFYWRCGFDVSTVRFWELCSYLEDWETELVEGEPRRFETTVTLQERELRLTLDEALSVTVQSERPLPAD